MSCNDRRLDPVGTETCQIGNISVPHMVLPMDLGYMALAFHMKGKASRLFMSEASRGSRSDRHMTRLTGQEFGKPGLW